MISINALKDTSFEIIVGAGPGCASVTHELSRFGKKVLVVSLMVLGKTGACEG